MGKREQVAKNKGLVGIKKFFQEFRDFAIKGRMIDMTVGVIVGGAFTAIVTSIVTNLATPFFGVLIGVDFKEWVIVLQSAHGNVEPIELQIGLFLNSVISFFVIAFVLFLFVRTLNKFRKKQGEAPIDKNEEVLLTEIRDLLKEIADAQKQSGNRDLG